MSLHYQEYGDKRAPLMLFIHGGGVSDWMWDKQIQYFTHYHCVVPLLPEHGLNNDKVKFTIKGSAQALIKLVEDKARGKKVILIGFSLGSQVIVEMISMKPDIMNFAIINSASVRPILWAKKVIKPTIALTYPLIQNKTFSKLQARTLYISDDYFEKYYEESCQISSDTLVRVLEENMSFQLPKNFAEATGKILVTVGEKEKAMMKKSAKDIVAANSNGIGVIIPNIGHGVSFAMPDFFNHMVETWIQKGVLPNECKVIS